MFSGHKLPLKTYLLAIAIFTNSAKSLSALQLRRDLDVQYKTTWITILYTYDIIARNKRWWKIMQKTGLILSGFIITAHVVYAQEKSIDPFAVNKTSKNMFAKWKAYRSSSKH